MDHVSVSYRPLPFVRLIISLWKVLWMYHVEIYVRVRRACMVARDERSGSLPGVWPAPGHGAQDAGLLGAPRIPTPERGNVHN